MQKNRILASLLSLIMMVAAAISAEAQQSSSSGSSAGTEPKPAGATSPGSVVLGSGQDENAAPGSSPVGPVDPYSGKLKEVGTGLPLFGTSTTPLRWGDFSISRFEYVGLHSDSELNGANTHTTSDISLFRTGLMFDHTFWKSRIVLQYLPQLAIFQGQVHANANSNNTFTVGTNFALTPRLSLTVQDAFVQARENQLIPENFMATNWAAGAVSQNSFLNTNGDFLSNTASATLQYAFSPRTSFAVSPSYSYARMNSSSTSPQFDTDGQVYQVTVSVSHALTPYRRVGIAESYSYARQFSVTAIDARYSTTTLFYSEQLSPSWWVSGNAGASYQSNSNIAGLGGWAFSGGGSLTGSISRIVGLSVAYTRGVAFNNYISIRQSDRLDGTIGLHLGPRVMWNNGGGYFRETGANPRTSGKYATSGFSYNLFGNISCFAAYSHVFQTSNTQQLVSGKQNIVEFGVRWQPSILLPR